MLTNCGESRGAAGFEGEGDCVSPDAVLDRGNNLDQSLEERDARITTRWSRLEIQPDLPRVDV